MQETDEGLVGRLHREAVANAPQGEPARPAERCTIHHANLPEGGPDSPLRTEWDCCRREMARLLAEGYAGRFVLVKGEQILGLYATEAEALAQGYQRFHGEPFLVHQVRESEPVLLGPTVCLCRS